MPATDLPSNLAFEREVLGAAIVDPDALDLVTGQARAEHFFSSANRAVFEAISAAYARGTTIDAGLLRRHMEREGVAVALPENVSSIQAYIAALIANRCPAVAVAERLVDIKACYDSRVLHAAAQRMQNAALETEGDPLAVENAITQTTEEIATLTENIVGHPWQSIGQSIEEAATNNERAVHFTTGLRDLDRLLGGGLRPGQAMIIAARPAQGKSTLALDVARQASVRERVPGLIVSLEMNAAEISERFLSAEARVNLTNVSSRELSPNERDKIARAAENAHGAPLYTVAPDSPHWPTIRSMIVSAHRRLGIKYVVIDYIQLISADSSVSSKTSREQFISEVSRGLKHLALSLGITVIVVSQLNRGPEQRQDGRPAVSDLRESGQLEQDADIILLLHLPQTYDPTTPRAGEADIIVGKQRGGATGTVTAAAVLHYAQFSDMAYERGGESY